MQLRRRPTVLLTGFGPFPGVPENATTRLVPVLAHEARRVIPGYSVHAEILPTEWRAAPERLAHLIAEFKPVTSIHFGVSSRADGFVVEARGRNACGTHADACGRVADSDRIAHGGPDFLSSTLPTGLIVARLRRRGLPATVSRDAGNYLCNALLYHALMLGRLARHQVRSGFIHLPDRLASSAPGARRAIRGCSLDFDGAVAGGLEILAVAAGTAVPPL